MWPSRSSRLKFASDPSLRARFEREAKTIPSLSPSHICALYDVGETTGNGGAPLHYLVMEYLEGESLAERLPKGPLPTDQVVRIGIEIADVLDKVTTTNIEGLTRRAPPRRLHRVAYTINARVVGSSGFTQ